MKPKFPLYVVSKGRWDSRYTVKALQRQGVFFRVVVEEKEFDDYASVIDEKHLLVLDPQYQRDYDTFDELGDEKSKGPGAARNFVWDHSISEGHEWHWVMDDNIREFYRLNRNQYFKCHDGAFWRAMEDFCTRYDNVAMAGPNYFMFAPRKNSLPPFVTNTRIYSCNLIRNDAPFRWRGRYNEDTDLSLRMLKAGWCTIQFYAFLQDKITTQVLKGGNTAEFYAKEGTYPKSQMLVDMHPDVARLKFRFGRMHHFVDYTPFKKNKLVRRPNLEVKKGTNEYGLKEVSPMDRLKKVKVKGVEAMCRPGTSDAFVVDEVIKGGAYSKLSIGEGDVVADIGMNIGMFSVWAAQQGAIVHGFEPDPENFELAKRNIQMNGVEASCHPNNLAVTGTNDKTRSFSINLKRNKGAHSLVKKRGRNSIEVDAIHLAKVIERVDPTVIKMDIEGGEDEAIHAVENFGRCRELIMEFHHAHLNENKPGEPRPRYDLMIAKLEEHFDVVEYRKEPKKAWVTLIYCYNQPEE